MSRFTPGMRLHDRFVLVDRIGTGGMAQVWRATDEVLGRPVAVKLLSAEFAQDDELREATWREARAAARLTHPNVTRIYDYGQAPLPDGGRAPYLVMELVEGESLAARLAAGPLPWPAAARIGAYVGAALAAAHALGVVHHDIKPGNVMLTAEGAKVLDFGTAALVGAIDDDVLVGTPTYTSPERLDWGPAQPASDLYSLGVLLYEALTGAPPAILASWDEAAAAHRAGLHPRTTDPPGLPAEAGELLHACLSRDPAQRPPARQVAAALAAAGGIPDPAARITAEPPTIAAPRPAAARGAAAPPTPPTQVDDRSPEPASPPPRRGGRLLVAGLAVTAVVLGLLAVTLALALSRSGGPEATTTGPPAPPAPTSTPPATTPPASTRSEPADARAVLAGVDQAIQDARRDGSLDEKTADRLSDKLEDVRKELNKPNEEAGKRAEKAREKADDLREEIARGEQEGTVSGPLAAELRDLLAPLDDLIGRG